MIEFIRSHLAGIFIVYSLITCVGWPLAAVRYPEQKHPRLREAYRMAYITLVFYTGMFLAVFCFSSRVCEILPYGAAEFISSYEVGLFTAYTVLFLASWPPVVGYFFWDSHPRFTDVYLVVYTVLYFSAVVVMAILVIILNALQGA